MTLSDVGFMRRALALAERGRGRTSPNPMVGAVLVSSEGVVVGQGYHERAGGPHAEIRALEDAGEKARGATLYCALEPCCHQGRTGPCVVPVAAAGVKRLVIGVEDPDPRVAGKGIEFLRARGIDVEVGVLEADARRLNEAFFTTIRKARPFVTAKVALSLDACVAATHGGCTRMTGEEAARRSQRLRAEVDALAIGVGTLLVDDPRLTARDVYRWRPLVRVIFDSTLRTPPEARVLTTIDMGPVIVVTTEAGMAAQPEAAIELRRRGVQLLPTDGHVASGLAALRPFGINTLLLEGGPTLHAAAWREHVVDRIMQWVTPAWMDRLGVPWTMPDDCTMESLSLRRVETCGHDVLLEADVHGAH